MTSELSQDVRAALYGAVKGWAHGKDWPYTLIGFQGRTLTEGNPLREQIVSIYPSACFDIKVPGDTLKLENADGERFLGELQRYRQEHGITDTVRSR
jgi:hypothetical protein